MPKVTGKGVYYDRPLSNMSVDYRPENFIADKLFPTVNVPKQSGTYYVYSQADNLRIEDAYRAPGVPPLRVTYGVGSANFFCPNYMLKDTVPWEDIKNADPGFKLTERSSRAFSIKDTLMLGMEYRVAALAVAGVGSSSAVASAWTDKTNSDPLSNMFTAFDVVEDLTGKRVNRVAMSGYAWKHFRRNSKVKNELFGESGAGESSGRIVTIDRAKALLEVDEILIGGTYYNASEEEQSMSLNQIWDENVICYVAPSAPRKDVPSFGYSFNWTAMGTAMQAKIRQDEDAEAEEVRLGYYQTEKIVDANLGFLISNVGSST